MAAFPPPTLVLYLDHPLSDLVSACYRSQDPEYDYAFVDPTEITHWFQSTSPTEHAVALDQFERLLSAISRHRGPIDGRRAFDLSHMWQSPHDCLDNLADWRLAIAEAIRGMDDPPFFNPNWMTETVVALRDAILAEKAFDRLPILADALEEAGCDNRFILDHLRGDDDHAHMCWVLDLLSVGAN